MKKILSILICLLVTVISYGQFVNSVGAGSSTTLNFWKGGISSDSATIILSKHSFTDTTTANFSVISKYRGTVIQLTDGSYWIRQLLPNKWNEISTSSATLVSISQGYGIVNTPNPITTTGTVTVDTTAISTKANVTASLLGYVKTIGVTTANGVSASSSGGQDPRLTVTLGNITPTSVSTSGGITSTGRIDGLGGLSVTGVITATGGISTLGNFSGFGLTTNGGAITGGTTAVATITATSLITTLGITTSGNDNYAYNRNALLDPLSKVTKKYADSITAALYPGLQDSLNRKINTSYAVQAFNGTNYLPTDSILWYGNSVTSGSNLGVDSFQRFTAVYSRYAGITEYNRGLSGTSMELQSPFNIGAAMTQRLGTIPTKTVNYKLIAFEYGVNDMFASTTSANYNITNYKAAYDTVIAACLAKGWNVEDIIIMGIPWVSFGYAVPIQMQWIQATRDVAFKWGTKYIDLNRIQQENGDSTQFIGSTVHPNIAGNLIIAKSLYKYLNGSMPLNIIPIQASLNLPLTGGTLTGQVNGTSLAMNAGITTTTLVASGALTSLSGNFTTITLPGTASQYVDGTGHLQTLASNDVTSITGTVNQITTSASVGAVTLSIPSALIVSSSISSTNLYGTLQTAAQTNITSVGTLTGLITSGKITGTTANFSGIPNGSASDDFVTISGGELKKRTVTIPTGSGTTNTVPKWISSTVLGNSLITDDGSTVVINTVNSFPNNGISTSGNLTMSAGGSFNIYNASQNRAISIVNQGGTGTNAIVMGDNTPSTTSFLLQGSVSISGATLTTTGNIQGSSITATGGINGTLTTAAQPNITSVGALTSGSIGSGFGSINNGSNSITGGAGSFTTGAFSAGLNINTSSGNFGIGTSAPQSLFYANVRGATIGTYTTISNNSAAGWTSLANNAAATASNSETTGWTYMVGDLASRVALTNGGFKFQYAGSGSAGSAITWTDGLTIASASGGGAVDINGHSFTAGTVTATSVIQLPLYTVATLPGCAVGQTGQIVFVTDALAPSFLVTLVGGGTVKTMAACNGTNWVANSLNQLFYILGALFLITLLFLKRRKPGKRIGLIWCQ